MFEKLQLGMTKKNFNKTEDVSKERNQIFNLPLVNAKHGNNGIMYYGKDSNFESAEMTIDIVNDGAIATGDVYPQPQRTGVLYNAYLIKLKKQASITKKSLFYLASAIQKSIKMKYGYDNKAGWEKVKNEKIFLPTTIDGKIDFTYMDNYIDNIDNLQYDKIEDFLSTNGLSNSELNNIEFKTIKNIYKTKSAKFKCGTIFDIYSPPKRYNANSISFKGKYPYIARISGNNGIKGYTTQNEKFLCKQNTIAFGQDTATMYFQSKPYFTGDKIKVMELRNHELTENIALFLKASMKKSFSSFSWGVTSFEENVLKDVDIWVPVTSTGKIDFEFMNSFISAQKKLIAEKVVRWLKQQQINDNILEIERNLPKDVLPMVAENGCKS